MNIQSPLVTVITPTYNQANYLPKAIESVISQNYPSIEYIVLNDGSTDQTEDVLKKYSGQIIWETQPNMGEYRTINKGAKMAKGEYLLILSSDDYLLPGAIQALVQYMQDHPHIIVAYPDYNIVNEKDEIIKHIRNYDYDYRNAVRWFACMPGPATLIKESIFTTLNGRDNKFRFVGDFDFYLRAGLLGEFARVPQTLASYRWHTGSQTQNKDFTQAEEHIRLLNKYFSLPNLPDYVKKIKSEAFSSAYYIAGVVCSDDPYNWKKRLYFLRALLFSPVKYLSEYEHRLESIFRSLLGKKLQKIICHWIKKHKSKNNV